MENMAKDTDAKMDAIDLAVRWSVQASVLSDLQTATSQLARCLHARRRVATSPLTAEKKGI